MIVKFANTMRNLPFFRNLINFFFQLTSKQIDCTESRPVTAFSNSNEIFNHSELPHLQCNWPDSSVSQNLKTSDVHAYYYWSNDQILRNYYQNQIPLSQRYCKDSTKYSHTVPTKNLTIKSETLGSWENKFEQNITDRQDSTQSLNRLKNSDKNYYQSVVIKQDLVGNYNTPTFLRHYETPSIWGNYYSPKKEFDQCSSQTSLELENLFKLKKNVSPADSHLKNSNIACETSLNDSDKLDWEYYFRGFSSEQRNYSKKIYH